MSYNSIMPNSVDVLEVDNVALLQISIFSRNSCFSKQGSTEFSDTVRSSLTLGSECASDDEEEVSSIPPLTLRYHTESINK